LVQLHKALGDETRLRIINLLIHRGELCVCDVESVLDISQSKASRHLTYLKHSGVVTDRRHGTWVYYRLASELTPAVRSALKEISTALAEDPAAKEDIERAKARFGKENCSPLTIARGSAK
jgi:ArsR family transcriptional regulator